MSSLRSPPLSPSYSKSVSISGYSGRTRSVGRLLLKPEKKSIQEQLKDFIYLPDNRFCADCFMPNPQWCALTHGVCICENCASVHRNLGTHISVVKSLVYDNWTEDMFEKLVLKQIFCFFEND
ncbi:hypothetical protein RFI_18705 [Reticulomyxa filosa]|uniref:Arf-GAP domain-containing protein n=1 Tax=Reticulomyxa filosa TaxID=46433 RepID=X6MX22_RETFI|nr:hypothetical protein RFI_18705 [Reticulomyxa filosa]|eukprot:ETO18563.1 hypothetical protein RFI_18705 [Reticulomyxa filosa]